MAKTKQQTPSFTATELRMILLRYFYERNQVATCMNGKKGSSAKISVVKKELKDRNGLTQQQVQSNLLYLISQGWVEKHELESRFRTPDGTPVPPAIVYTITAAGIDKIEGPGEFTMPKFQGININATGQNIITLGDGNQINSQFGELGEALVDLRGMVTRSSVAEIDKMSIVADIDTIQSQLAKPKPSKGILQSAWEGIQAAASIDGCAALIGKVGRLIAGVIG